MEIEEDYNTVLELADEKITIGNKLIQILEDHKNVPGVQKIQRKVNQEIKFLQKVKTTNSLKLNHVMCSNLTHYDFLVKVLIRQKDLIHVDCGFVVEERQYPLRVDIVCENGSKWIKVIARNSKSLSEAAQGRTSYGAKSIVDQAEEFICAASQNLYMFKEPKIVFCFSQEIEPNLLNELKSTGVDVISLTIDSTLSSTNALLYTTDSSNTIDQEQSNVNILNLDITTMLAYVSSLTNGSCNWKFKEPILTEQAEKERQCPLKPILANLFHGNRLVCCDTAMQSFQEIVNLLAGRNEKKRAEELIANLELFPDIEEIPKELSILNVGGKIKPRSLKIFAFGLAMKAITVTSNEGFIRSAKMQGINVPVIVHQARALTEAKELTGMQIES